ncbi:nitroreductase family protein [Flavihumibacter fluvii]|uniref:nitroreductase family protein n=1 Tax=Flavihumibacter fluvii TaxID=2838157 RepID=UPI001BDDF232|nr:nitroreductase family protein [Flavihumibacter fluvii]ULQ51237.1 nitroreductase family protein [Flavihumibacter fluvii]
MNYLEDFNWRYATKRMNGKPVPAEALNNILESTRLAPTSLGLQPFDVIVVEDAELRRLLSPAIYNQPQVNEGAALIIFAAWKKISPDKVDAYIKNIAVTRNTTVVALEGFKNMILDSISGKSDDQVFQWNARQSYIALGYAIAAAAFEKVDSTPMEGFNPAEVNRILGLEEKGLSAVSILAIGYRDEEKDYLANAPKVRRPAESFFTIYENEPVA